jgi:dTDP-4-amino-4,6-dideoxygalactose transaminase
MHWRTLLRYGRTVKVPFLDLRAILAPVRGELDASIARVLDSGVFIGGPEVEAFERELASFAGARHAIGTSSGTDALLAILMALGIGPGDEVVTTPFTFFATAGAVARLGARLVFADIDVTFNLDPRAALAACSHVTKAIITVHLFGRPAQLPTASCAIIEDAAQSLGSGFVAGRAAALSHFPSKPLGSLGDAGSVLTDDAELADRIRLLRNHGARPKYHHLAVGGNFRLDALQAAILRTRLPRVASAIAARRTIAAHYRDRLVGLPIELPADHPTHVYHQFVIRAPRRDALRDHLARNGIETAVYYPEPLHLQPCFAHLGYGEGSMPNSERAAQEVLALPIYSTLPAASRETVADAIRAFY